jgi:large repetitive protein
VTRRLMLLACIGLALAGGLTRFSSAAFTNATAVPSNAVAVDKLANYFSVVPGTAVQAGTSTSIASGDVDSLSLAFGTVPSARTFTSVFSITNVSGSSQTATLVLSGAAQISSAVFASSGTTSVTLTSGGSTTLTVTTSATIAGHGTGSLKLTRSGTSWMYRTYPVTIDEAPEVPGAPTATQAPNGLLNLSWGVTSTTTNLAGYNLYRSSGAGFTKLNAMPLTGTTYADSATVDGTSYTYKVRAVSSGAPTLESVDSTTVTATADATPPGQPTGISLANGGGNGSVYVNAANAGSLSVNVNVGAGSLASDQLTLTLTNGASSVTRTASATAGAGTVTISSINVSGLGDGTVTITATSTDAAGNISSGNAAGFTKDTVAPGAPVASYTDKTNTVADVISGTAEANASITVTETVPGAGTFGGSAGGGAFLINVAAIHGTNGSPKAYSYSVTATDAAGNTSSAAVVAGSDIN